MRSSPKEANCNTCAQYVLILSDPKSKSASHYNRIRFDPNKLKSMLQSQRSDEHVRLPTQYSTSCVNETLTKDDKSPVTGNFASKNPVNKKPSSVAPSIGSRVHRDIPFVSALSFDHEGAALPSPKSRSSPRESVIVPLARLRGESLVRGPTNMSECECDWQLMEKGKKKSKRIVYRIRFRNQRKEERIYIFSR